MAYNPLSTYEQDPFRDQSSILSIEDPSTVHSVSEVELNTQKPLGSHGISNSSSYNSSSTEGNSATKHHRTDKEEQEQEKEEEEEEEVDLFDPIQFKQSQDQGDMERTSLDSFRDDFGNVYDSVNFDNKKYTQKLTFKGTKLVYFTSAFVSLFVSLFGYEQGVCSGILAFDTFNLYFNHPSAATIGLVISILEIGAMISSILVAKISDNFGRKRTILLGTFIFMIGGTLQSFCPNMFVFAVGRVLSGVGVGILSTIVPSYQCEISPSEERGKLVCGEFTGNISGYALSVWVDYFCYFIQDIGNTRKNPNSFLANLSWRLPLFIQVVLAFVLFLGGFFIVESPRWLLDNDMDQQGFNVLSLLYDSHPSSTKPKTEFFLIKNSILHERQTIPKSERTWRLLISRYKQRVFVACSSLVFAQLNGINIISYYAPMVFLEAGFNDSGALLMTGINGLIYLLSTIPPWFLVDKWGRRPILISSGIAMGVCLSLVSIFMFLNKSYTASIVAVLVIIYNASFGFGFGPIPFLLSGESYPLSVRSKGVSLAVACNWLSNFIVGLLAPILRQNIQWAMYLFPAGSCILSVICVILFYPETKGAELEEIDAVFDDFYAESPFTRMFGSFSRKRNRNRITDEQGRRMHAAYDRLENDLLTRARNHDDSDDDIGSDDEDMVLVEDENIEMEELNNLDYEYDTGNRN
ncbi:hypothetical protein KGF56_002154 [Candida oxycetoniae]|uniref:Major facilitator superfamily (MFS) profile domain-containing protein n=1 Tax=Candida oxycetoniae TaxID=497107 RepID=A0AAI9SY73_9ASCO|nr:uncharacterized protein KGF56_002154 [Candida oxycetoniae]KAI3405069.2 hypothetical protein KGF56_002154 [Candida oxycetoniae]